MIILPPEEKKSSPLAKWIFRILVALCVFIGMSLFGLSILAGTSDAHRHGLEQAMSNIFRSRVEITTLKTFNVFPQFLIDTEDVNGQGSTGEKNFHAGQIKIAFALVDLLQERGFIEDFQVTDLHLQPGMVGQQELVFSSIRIIPATLGTAPYVKIEGNYGGTPLAGSIELTPVPRRGRPSYRFTPGKKLQLTLGKFHLDGQVGDNKEDFQEIRDISLKLEGEEVLTGSVLIKPVDGKFALHISFKLGASTGKLIYVPSSSHQNLSFDTAVLEDFTADRPLWARLAKAWHEDVVRSVSVKQDKSLSADKVSFTIKSLVGSPAGENISGSFVYTPDHIVGWWQGQLSGIQSQNAKIPASGSVNCALLKLVPKNEVWLSDYVLTMLPPYTVKGKLEIHESTGRVKYQTLAVAEKQSVLGENVSDFITYHHQLGLAGHKVCPDLSELSPPPAIVKPEAVTTPAAAPAVAQP